MLRIGLVYPILNNIYLGEFVISFIYFVVAAITDALDGFLARKMNWQTYLGTILDPVADKLLLSGTIFILWINEYIPLYIFIIFFGRDVVILLGAAIHMTLIETDTPLPNILGKITTTLQVIYILLIMFLQIFEFKVSLVGLDFFIILITILSLIVYSKDWFISLNRYHNE
jgi:cardiolipin synthase